MGAGHRGGLTTLSRDEQQTNQAALPLPQSLSTSGIGGSGGSGSGGGSGGTAAGVVKVPPSPLTRALAGCATLLAALAFLVHGGGCPAACAPPPPDGSDSSSGSALLPAYVVAAVLCNPWAQVLYPASLVGLVAAAWLAARRQEGHTLPLSGAAAACCGDAADGAADCGTASSRCVVAIGGHHITRTMAAAARNSQLALVCAALAAHAVMLALLTRASPHWRNTAVLPLIASQTLMILAAGVQSAPSPLSRVIQATTTLHLAVFPAAAVRAVLLLASGLQAGGDDAAPVAPAAAASVLTPATAALLIATFAGLVVHAAHAAALQDSFLSCAIIAVFFTGVAATALPSHTGVASIAGAALVATAAAAAAIARQRQRASRAAAAAGIAPPPLGGAASPRICLPVMFSSALKLQAPAPAFLVPL